MDLTTLKRKVLEDINVLESPPDKNSHRPLCIACITNDNEMIKWLCDFKPELASIECEYCSLTPLTRLCVNENLHMVKYLLDVVKVDVNQRSKSCMTAIHIACDMDNLEMVKYLIEEKNANLNVYDYVNRTPFELACVKNRTLIELKNVKRNIQLIEYLLNTGKIDKKDIDNLMNSVENEYKIGCMIQNIRLRA